MSEETEDISHVTVTAYVASKVEDEETTNIRTFVVIWPNSL
jgi:hypothetical protein